jgi:hypothetical protein
VMAVTSINSAFTAGWQAFAPRFNAVWRPTRGFHAAAANPLTLPRSRVAARGMHELQA